jgi:hypothetical protein
MAFAKNTRTGKFVNVPDHYIGHPVFGGDLIVADTEAMVEPTKEKKKKSVKYVPNAIDADGDGLVQDGTEWERPVGTEINQEQTAPETNIEDEEHEDGN